MNCQGWPFRELEVGLQPRRRGGSARPGPACPGTCVRPGSCESPRRRPCPSPSRGCARRRSAASVGGSSNRASSRHIPATSRSSAAQCHERWRTISQTKLKAAWTTDPACGPCRQRSSRTTSRRRPRSATREGGACWSAPGPRSCSGISHRRRPSWTSAAGGVYACWLARCPGVRGAPDRRHAAARRGARRVRGRPSIPSRAWPSATPLARSWR